MTAVQVALAYLIDLIVGDPRQIPHPVVLIGKAVTFLERHLRRLAAPVVGLRVAGVILTIIVVGLTYTITWGIVRGAYMLHNRFGFVTATVLLSTTLAVKCLGDAAMEIYALLSAGDMAEARRKTGWIVGRDTATLDEKEITRATVETVAENIVDGIVAPLFYAFLGGAPLAMAYKAVNTLDSMVGYKNEKYRELGWASARFDDICNYIPARLTGALLLAAFLLVGRPVRKAAQTVRRDAPRHPSPNSGIPEAAVAGALGVRLGGTNYYDGVASFRAYMGDPEQELNREHIRTTVGIMRVTSAVAVLAGVMITCLASALTGTRIM